MRPDRLRNVDVRLYGAALWLCPPEFRRDYGGEMVRDFLDARADAQAGGRRRDLWLLRAQMGLDVLRTIGVQWSRTGLPLIGLVSMVMPLTLLAGIARLASRARFTIPAGTDQELMGIMLLAVTSFFVIAATIALTVCAPRPVRRRRR